MPAIMQARSRWFAAAERGCLAIFFAWLAWLPLPFGSVIERARLPLIAVPLALGAIVIAIRLAATRDRNVTFTRAALVWGCGTLVFCAVAALQLIPLPPSVLNAVSPESHLIWSHATRVAAMAGIATGSAHPISIDPRATTLELFRVLALFATFLIAALLIRNHVRRMILIAFIAAAALFQIGYGVHEAVLGRYAIWGWPNRLIHGRVTGTFVNPNHFGHYVALAVPLALFVAAMAWRDTRGDEVPLGRRLVRLIEHRMLPFAFGILTAIACAAGVLLAQSRGALLALAAGLALAAALLPRKRILRISFLAAGGLIVVAALILFLGTERTVARFIPNEFERNTFVGRKIGIDAAHGVWQRFPILGSGLGTFERVVSMEQALDLEKIYHHAHNDYAEIAATGGTLAFVVAAVTLIGGYVLLVRQTRDRELSWKRRAFQSAALASLTIALVHALFDFNFYIPANPATLAAILGAAVASVDHDRRTRR